jgi:hypothetical protein
MNDYRQEIPKSRTENVRLSLYEPILLSWDDHPQDEVDQYTRHATRDECNEHRQAEPERTDAKELGKSTTDTRNHAVTFGSAQNTFLIDCHF